MLRGTVLLAVAALLGLSGCNDDGRTLAPAPTVADERPTTSTSTPATAPEPAGLSLTSPAFADGDPLDPTFTCDGVDIPPELVFQGVPPTTAELAIVVTDRDADGYVHWVLTGLDPSLRRLDAGVIPPEAVAAETDGGVVGWQGPCPPPGDGPHTYEFALHALAEPVGLAPGTDGRRAVELVAEASMTSAVLLGTYER